VNGLAHVALIVRDYDEAIAWFAGKLGFANGAGTPAPPPNLLCWHNFSLISPAPRPKGSGESA